jgi:hypothetical protein
MTATPSALRFLLSQFQLFIAPARACVAETLTLEPTLSDLVNRAYALIPAEISLMWQTAAAHAHPAARSLILRV